MTELTYLEDYWDDPLRKREFIRFLSDIHNLDLTNWDNHGLWDHDYRPFSYFHGATVAANVCVYSLQMRVNGRDCQLAQVSAVGTRPEYRGRGLSSELTRRALEWAAPEHEFYFLFADEEAYPFYQKRGFRFVVEHKTRIAVSGESRRPSAAKLDIDNPAHFELIRNYAENREPVSDLLGVSNDRLLLFWCLYGLRESIYHLPGLETMVLMKRERGLLSIYDIVSSKLPPFTQLYPLISSETDTAIEFYFMTDKLQLATSELIQLDGSNGTHLSGSFPLEGRPFIFPYTSQA
jgi:GNAT superfamily N-acetyltransferase